VVYDGFWAAGLEGSPDNMNATKVQISAAGSRPAAAKNGVVHIATDTGVISEDNGSSWDIRGYVDVAGPGTAIAKIKTGSYTGDGATSLAITGVGFTPKLVMISKRLTTDGSLGDRMVIFTTNVIMDDAAAGGAITINISGGNDACGFDTNAIIALGSDGFTVDDNGTDDDPNATAIVYNYYCIG
jgi:hypothetical protein